MRSERVNPCDAEGVARRWGLDDRVASLLVALESEAAWTLANEGLCWPGVWIISGYRTSPVEPAFNPGGPAARASLHMVRPALAADLRVGNSPASLTDPSVWTFLGGIWERLGGRWGGRFDPPDWNHFDLGHHAR